MATFPITLTYDQARADLLELVANEPERTVDQMGGACVYFATDDNGTGPRSDLLPGQGCCIVGRVLERHGVTYEDISGLNEGATVNDLRAAGVLDLDFKALSLLSEAQAAQDSGYRWADAVTTAIQKAEDE